MKLSTHQIYKFVMVFKPAQSKKKKKIMFKYLDLFWQNRLISVVEVSLTVIHVRIHKLQIFSYKSYGI